MVAFVRARRASADWATSLGGGVARRRGVKSVGDRHWFSLSIFSLILPHELSISVTNSLVASTRADFSSRPDRSRASRSRSFQGQSVAELTESPARWRNPRSNPSSPRAFADSTPESVRIRSHTPCSGFRVSTFRSRSRSPGDSGQTKPRPRATNSIEGVLALDSRLCPYFPAFLDPLN